MHWPDRLGCGQIFLDVVLERALGETLLMCPLFTSTELVEFLITMSAEDLASFLIGYVVQVRARQCALACPHAFVTLVCLLCQSFCQPFVEPHTLEQVI